MSVVSAQLCLTLCDRMDYSPPAPVSMEFSRQEYWSGLPFPSPEILPTKGSNPQLVHLLYWQVDFFTTSATQEAPNK